MFGHQWVRAEAIVAAVHLRAGAGDGDVVHVFAVDVRPPAGWPVRALVEEPAAPGFCAPDVGDVVGVEVDEHGRVRFDPHDPRLGDGAEGEATPGARAPRPGGDPAPLGGTHDTEGLARLFADAPSAEVIRLDPAGAPGARGPPSWEGMRPRRRRPGRAPAHPAADLPPPGRARPSRPAVVRGGRAVDNAGHGQGRGDR